jgi:hypothetical protein
LNYYFSQDVPPQADSPGLASPVAVAAPTTPTPPIASPALPAAPAPVPMPTLDSLPAHLKKPTPATQQIVNQLVRKEFDKSLAQVEFPRGPPQPDIFFIPNANHIDFLMCLGLEDVVRSVQEHLISKQLQKEKQEKKAAEKDQQGGDVKQEQTASTTTPNVIEIKYEYPNICAQCSTDFTPMWRKDKNGTAMCERCLKQLEKRQAKQEHAAKLKQLFVKATKDREVFEKQALAEQHQQLLLQEQERLERAERLKHQQLLAQQAARLEQQRLEQQRLEQQRVEQQRLEQLRILQQQQQQVHIQLFFKDYL